MFWKPWKLICGRKKSCYFGRKIINQFECISINIKIYVVIIINLFLKPWKLHTHNYCINKTKYIQLQLCGLCAVTVRFDSSRWSLIMLWSDFEFKQYPVWSWTKKRIGTDIIKVTLGWHFNFLFVFFCIVYTEVSTKSTLTWLSVWVFVCVIEIEQQDLWPSGSYTESDVDKL